MNLSDEFTRDLRRETSREPSPKQPRHQPPLRHRGLQPSERPEPLPRRGLDRLHRIDPGVLLMLREHPIDQLPRDAASAELEPNPCRAIPPPRLEPRMREPAGEGEVVQEPPGDQALEHGLDLIGGILPLDQPSPELRAGPCTARQGIEGSVIAGRPQWHRGWTRVERRGFRAPATHHRSHPRYTCGASDRLRLRPTPRPTPRRPWSRPRPPSPSPRSRPSPSDCPSGRAWRSPGPARSAGRHSCTRRPTSR